MESNIEAYNLSQRALADIKTAIFLFLKVNAGGSKNSEIGKALGIYQGHSGKHEGHISRTLLEQMRTEGIVKQDDETKKWSLT